ncbi:hypothetical protein Tco_0235669, partial [Tanacetum coccineum]
MPYGLLLTRLYDHITLIHPQLQKSKYQSFPHTMALMGHYDDYFDHNSKPPSDDESDDQMHGSTKVNWEDIP